MSLQAFLTAALTGSVALGPILFSLLRTYGWLERVPSKYRALTVAGLSGAVSLALWGLAAWLGYVPLPATRTAAAEAIWTYGILSGFAAYTTATALHGYTKDRE